MENHSNNKNNAQTLILLLVLALILTTISFGQIARWELLQQIAMSDRYSLLGSLYPDTNLAIPTDYSPYFPGVAFLALMVKNIVPNNLLIYSMHIITVVVVMSFFMVQKRITSSVYKDININNFYIGIMIFSLVLCKHYLFYALAFKPDTIAFLLGSLGIIIARADDNTRIKYLPYVFGAIITGCALIFKQQYIIFPIGMIFYSLISRNSKFQKFTALSLCFSLLVLFLFYQQEFLFFWNLTNLSDDGFIPITQWALVHAQFVISIVQLIIILYALQIYGYVNIDSITNFISLKNLLKTPWPTLVVLSAMTAFASSWKTGGNQGNSELGLILLFPLFYFLIQKFDKMLLIIISWVVFLGMAPDLYKSAIKINNSTQLNKAATSLILDSNSLVLSGSGVYGAARKLNTLNPIHSLWTYWEITKDDNILSNLLEKKTFDVIVLSNNSQNRQPLTTSSLYAIYFENDLGIIAIKN